MRSVDNREHFDNIAAGYQKSVLAQTEFQKSVARELEAGIKYKEILDIGNGGVFMYDYRLARRVTVLDVSPKMLERIQNPAVIKMLGDARIMSGGGVLSGYDVIIINQTLHHVNGVNFEETSAGLKKIMDLCYEVLAPDGELVIIEPVLARPLFWLERKLFPVIRRLFGALGKSVVFFFSSNFILTRLKEAFPAGASSVVKTLALKEWMDPMPAIFPGIFKIPPAFYPTTFTIFRFKKDEDK